MKRLELFRHFILFSLPLCAAALYATGNATAHTPEPFSKYQLILDRMPFGALPPNFGQAEAAAPAQTDAQVQAEQQKLAKQINMSCVNVTPDGTTAIGFTDLEAKPPVNYYLLVGASAGGWTVVKADYDEEWAQLEKDGVTITLKLGKGLIEAPPLRDSMPIVQAPVLQTVPAIFQPNAKPNPKTAQDSEISFGSIRRPSQGGMPPLPVLSPIERAEAAKAGEELKKIRESGGDVRSYLDRLHERQQQEKADKANAEQAARAKLQELAKKITQDELAKKEREMNLSLLEQGAKPISEIQLTPEEEQALVDKGVLAQ